MCCTIVSFLMLEWNRAWNYLALNSLNSIVCASQHITNLLDIWIDLVWHRAQNFRCKSERFWPSSIYTCILGLIPESIIGELKTTQSGVKHSDEIIPGDSGYFSRTDSYAQSDCCDDTESGSETEKASSESGRLEMHPVDHCQTDRQLLLDTKVTSSKKFTGFVKLGSRGTRTTLQL
jgi:hypothetical protein